MSIVSRKSFSCFLCIQVFLNKNIIQPIFCRLDEIFFYHGKMLAGLENLLKTVILNQLLHSHHLIELLSS